MAKKSQAWRLDLSSVLNTGAHSDFEIECEGYIFKAHKAILACASPFFRAAINSSMREGIENRIEFPDDEAELIARVLIFIYSGVYETEDISKGLAGPIAQFNHVEDKYDKAIEKWHIDSELAIKMYSLGKRFFIPDLQQAARETFIGAIYNNRAGCVEVSSERISEDAATKDGKLVKLVYSMTEKEDWSLRDIMVRYALGYIEDCEMLCSEAFQQTLRDVPEYAIDIAGSRLSDNFELCKFCDEKVFERQWRCKCGKITNCSDQECANLRMKRSMCVWCSRFEVVEYTPQDPEPSSSESP
ncbi:hypothetical protein H2198_004127 [Neophaeococcomyces mojaviensis]|uniref:Uncharacterized protein n=1 Tax=Neophaeococcomyces mojaviensis TaxID=3383035 RepID=A0ACC3A9N6_9EURO|nr:hypothetical protein H2198_004127 [Knufia sp. JES_112]